MEQLEVRMAKDDEQAKHAFEELRRLSESQRSPPFRLCRTSTCHDHHRDLTLARGMKPFLLDARG
jgi:hypothetical protein